MVWTTSPNTNIHNKPSQVREVPSYWHIAQAYIQILSENQGFSTVLGQDFNTSIIHIQPCQSLIP